ncbi:Hypothetical predicted protein [Pelobates cultripes]|uniref:Uncharacterized protein n=1 Tax=Pelobates cultripes TaxID=61616 RepID=A0AAD1WC23_PELCU|nr:Hypothetical predicted protein [Pelobates cultripes]
MKPEYVDQSKPRDVMICCSSYKMKEQVIKASRLTKMKDPHSDIRIFPDISYHTRIKRKSFANYTKILHQKNIRYAWRYPCKIIVTYEARTYSFSDVTEFSIGHLGDEDKGRRREAE